MNHDLRLSIKSFDGVWRGGYYEGDPLDPLSPSTYGQIGYVSVLHATWLRCIKPYVNKETVALEIGPGRGAWTKTLLTAREVWALDALSAEHNWFWQYIGPQAHVRYVQVEDFECSMLPNEHFTFMFSFGTLCHIPFEGIKAYAAAIFPKLRVGAECFWMIADFDQFNRVVASAEHYSIARILPVPLALLVNLKRRVRPGKNLARISEVGEASIPARWHDGGLARTCAMMGDLGYDVVDPDVGTTPHDPIIYFRKPA